MRALCRTRTGDPFLTMGSRPGSGSGAFPGNPCSEPVFQPTERSSSGAVFRFVCPWCGTRAGVAACLSTGSVAPLGLVAGGRSRPGAATRSFGRRRRTWPRRCAGPGCRRWASRSVSRRPSRSRLRCRRRRRRAICRRRRRGGRGSRSTGFFRWPLRARDLALEFLDAVLVHVLECHDTCERHRRLLLDRSAPTRTYTGGSRRCQIRLSSVEPGDLPREAAVGEAGRSPWLGAASGSP